MNTIWWTEIGVFICVIAWVCGAIYRDHLRFKKIEESLKRGRAWMDEKIRTAGTISFEKFQASAREVSDIGAAIGSNDPDLSGRPGRIYLGRLFIEDFRGKPAEQNGRWWSIDGRCEIQSQNLEAVEKWLYRTAEMYGYLKEVEWF